MTTSRKSLLTAVIVTVMVAFVAVAASKVLHGSASKQTFPMNTNAACLQAVGSDGQVVWSNHEQGTTCTVFNAVAYCHQKYGPTSQAVASVDRVPTHQDCLLGANVTPTDFDAQQVCSVSGAPFCQTHQLTQVEMDAICKSFGPNFQATTKNRLQWCTP